MTMPDIPGAKETIDALKGTPMLLVLMIIVAAVLGMVTFLAWSRAQTIQAEKTDLIGLLKDCMSTSTKPDKIFSAVSPRFWYLDRK
jgi:uncharacterized protein HemX